MTSANPDFTNATFARVTARIAERASGMASALAYGMWNPDFCSADAAEDAAEFLAQLRADIEHWAARAAKAIEAQRAETVKHGSVGDESAVANGDLPKGGAA
jgi:hypothetical protein